MTHKWPSHYRIAPRVSGSDCAGFPQRGMLASASALQFLGVDQRVHKLAALPTILVGPLWYEHYRRYVQGSVPREFPVSQTRALYAT
ncbi:hypothetical protein Rmet_6744 (plasmid) [Cupriavidus metallidurans CH34]|uniref:Uncharacterized protein n=1 Tax=Cupriavidus metallidurans (strain ATCC 43123 / DSM 2839 / NBRC 102507 / CH34) TaxID=266264 RepID=D3DYF3_CUPMC|nr:hypothetical protein Rmet_6744 [Cupriavidus metallidurans CH34]